jgi:hypothetical protein
MGRESRAETAEPEDESEWEYEYDDDEYEVSISMLFHSKYSSFHRRCLW